MAFKTSRQMIFFPKKRRASLGQLTFVALVITAVFGVFLVGIRVGVQNAATINATAPFLTAKLVTFAH